MPDIEFDTDMSSRSGPTSYRPPTYSPPMNMQGGYSEPQGRGMAGWLQKKGIVKSERAGQGVLIVIVIINIIITILALRYIV